MLNDFMVSSSVSNTINYDFSRVTPSYSVEVSNENISIKSKTATVTFSDINKALISSGVLVVGIHTYHDSRLDEAAKKHADALEALQKAVPEFAAVVSAAKEYRALEKKIHDQHQVLDHLKG